MKLRHYLLAGWALLACLSSCKKTMDPLAPIETGGSPSTPDAPGGESAPLVCPIGEFNGNWEITQAVGPAGGTLASDDGSIRLEIPAGALTRTENISIQPLTNTNPSGKGAAYRLEPHGLTFAKPVRLSFSYTDLDLVGTVAEGLQIAYQNEAGIWMAMPGVELNRSARTVSIQTTHFSDWSFFASLFLSPQQRGVRPGESVPLKVYTTLVVDDFLAMLTPLDKERAVHSQQLVKLGNGQTVPVTQWALSEGIGKLATTGAGSTNTYTAPGSVQRPTPVTVTARIKSPGGHLLLLVSSLMVMPEGLVYRLDGGPWIHRQGTAFRSGGQVITIGSAKTTSTSDKSLALSLTIPQLPGQENIHLNWGPAAFFAGTTDGGYQYFDCTYGVGGSRRFSQGGIDISQVEYPKSSGLIDPITIHGSFSVQQAGEYTAAGYAGAHQIEGFFTYSTPK